MTAPAALETFLALPPDQRAEVLRMAAPRRSMEAFIRATWPEYRWNWHHRVLCDRLTALARGDITRLMVFMPPRHGKTELCSKRFVAWLLGLDPDTQILGVAHKITAAAKYNRATQRVIEEPTYRILFPETRLNSRNVRTMLQHRGRSDALRNAEEFEVVGHRGGYRSAGIQSGVAGTGAHFIIVDDPIKTRSEADSPKIRRKIWDEYVSGIYTRRENYRGRDARILMVLTRWHEDDLAGQLLAPGADEDWEVVNFPAVLDGDPGPLDPRRPGEALWPWKQDEDQWARFAKLDPRAYESLGQQRPRRVGGGLFKGVDFEWYGGAPPAAVAALRGAA